MKKQSTKLAFFKGKSKFQICFFLLSVFIFNKTFDQPPAFNCSDTAYLFQGNPTRMYGLNLNTGISQLLASPIITSPPNQGLNAFGYNRVDNYIWGHLQNTNHLVRIASDYSVDTFAIAGLPNNIWFNVADISDNGIMYIYYDNSVTLYRVDLNPIGNPQLILPNLTITPSHISDWAFSPIDGNIYTINNSTWHIYRFDTAGVRTDLGIANGGGIQGATDFGAIFMDSLGNMYAVNNPTGKIFKIAHPNTGNIAATFYSQGATSSQNDGASCAGAPIPSMIANFQSSVNALCPGTCISYSNLSVNATSYQWNFPGGIPSTSTDSNPQSICYEATGQYNVTLVATNGSATDTITFSNYITVYPSPAAPALTQSGDTLFAPQNFASYQWYRDSVHIISGATDYFYMITQTGSYSVTATDLNGCRAGASIRVTYLPCEYAWMIPNIFTPNNDGVNDTYHIDSICPERNFFFEVFNRWGIKMYESKDSNFYWNGNTDEDKPATDGIYYYLLTNGKHEYHGYISLKRD